MSSVFSKLIDKTSSRYGIPQERLTRGVVGVVTTLYLIKLGYPYLASKLRDHQARNANKKKREEQVKSSKCSKEKEKNGVVPGKVSDGKSGPSVGLDRAFVKQLIMLLRIMVPGWRTREAGLLACATLTLLARTALSVYVATLEGQIVKRIVLRDVKGFVWMMMRWFTVAFPATFVNSAIRYLEGRLALSFRERLVEYAYKMYLSQQTYYRVAALDTRLGGAEQRLTDDLSELASSVAHLYSSLTKPLLDCALVGIALISFSAKMGGKTIPGH